MSVLKVILQKLFSRVQALEQRLTSTASTHWQGVQQLKQHVSHEDRLIQALAGKLATSSATAKKRLNLKMNTIKVCIKCGVSGKTWLMEEQTEFS